MVATSNFEAVLAGGEQDDGPDNAFIFSFRLPQRMWQSRDVGYFKVGHANMGLVLTPRYTKMEKASNTLCIQIRHLLLNSFH